MRPATVVFVPGFMQRGDAWAPVAERVGERYPTVCLDFRSHSFAARLAEIAAAARAGDALVGYSMGGRLALHHALRASPVLGGLVLVGAGAGIEDDAQRAARATQDEDLATWIEHARIEHVVDRWERQPVFATQSLELVESQRAGRLSHDPKWLAVLLRSSGQAATPPVWDRLHELEVPLLAVAGELDGRYVAQARRIAELAPRGAAATIRGAGHAAHLEQPDAFAELLLDFLDQNLGERVVVDRDT